MEIERQHDQWLNAPRPLLGPKEGDDQRAITGDVRPHADPHGRARSSGLPPHHRRLVPAEVAVTARRSHRRARQALRRPHGRPRRRVRLRDGRRRALPALRHPLDPRAARGGLPADAQAHAGAVRRRRPRDGAAARRPKSSWRRSWTSSSTSWRSTEDRRARPDRRPRVRDRERRRQRRADRHLRGRRLLRDHRHRGPRHDVVVDRGWAARAARAPRPAPPAPRRPVARHDRGRRDDPLGVAGQAVHAHVAPTTTCCAASPIAAGESVLLSYPSANRDEDVFDRRRHLRRRAQPEQARRRSGSARTSASAPSSPAWRVAPSTASSCHGCSSIELAGEPAYMQTLFVGGPEAPPDPLRAHLGADARLAARAGHAPVADRRPPRGRRARRRLARRRVRCDADRHGPGRRERALPRSRYDGEPGPSTVVCKFASADPDSAAAGVSTLTYETEVAFYRHLADSRRRESPALLLRRRSSTAPRTS